MKGEYLGEFEELVLLTCLILKEDAYGINIVNEIKQRMSRSVNLSSVHVTLYRLEDKGLAKSYMGGTTSDRGGRRKRIFEPTDKGMEVLQELKANKVNIWNAIPELKLS
ncbi:PadR family transcriptional regulator [Ekhidna sp.]|uniref:PadR family transcriptional regulator n=1 Tax=Ekhidna sp. TaxID=2608089 RepID=UPI003CCBE6C8